MLSLLWFGLGTLIGGSFVYFFWAKQNLKPDLELDRSFTWRGEIIECGDPPEEGAKRKKVVLSDKEREALKDSKSIATLVKRAQKKITEYVEETEITLSMTTIFYGRNEKNQPDVKAFASFADESTALSYTGQDETDDCFMIFEKSNTRDLRELFERQDRR